MDHKYHGSHDGSHDGPNAGPHDESLSTRYMKQTGDREGWLALARRNSALTLPGLIPDTSDTRGQSAINRPIPHNNLGAQGVNTLSAKMVLQLLPPSQPFFRLEIKPDARRAVDELALTGGADAAATAQRIQSEVEENLVELETRLVREVGRENIRATAVEAFKHLLVAGNVVMHVPDKGNVGVIDLRHFTADRDPQGTLLNLTIKEEAAPITLSEEVIEACGLDKDGDVVEVFTGMDRIGQKKFRVYQEIMGKEVPGSSKMYPEDGLPFLVLRGTEAAGEHYGEALCSSYEGDLIVLEGISRAIKEAAIASSMVVFLVSPNAPIGLEDELAKAENGATIRASENDVKTLQVGKNSDLAIAASTGERAEQRLRQAFLLNNTRSAERVTAEEIRQNFGELQQALGGTFAILADNFQRPLLARLMVRLKARGGLAGIEDALTTVEPILITGVDAIGRNSELNNLMAFIQALTLALGPQAAAALNQSEIAVRIANATSVKATGLILSEEELRSANERSMMQEAGIKAAPSAISAGITAAAKAPAQEN